ncbi:MAG TPA: CCA tRNA nucleotidyltransferase, partial [Gemmatimonadales bacterium]|nr:CCA tRNA nucleotidyltransferase [Gemmatimonadales bacterium]
MTIPLPQLTDLPAEIIEIAGTLEAAGFETWCVGGALRDRVLGYPSEDVDLATAAKPEAVLQLFRRTVAVGVRFGTVGVLDRRNVLHEVTTFRKDVATDGRHATVEFGVSLEEDLARRDFTINALAYHPLRHEWRDPFAGGSDLQRRVVRAVGDPARRFAEDYLRSLRALRFAARFEFEIEPATWNAARSGVSGLSDLSAERVREEWFKGLETARSLVRLSMLWREVGAAARWLPELVAQYPFASATPAPRDPVVLTVGLCGEPATLLQRLRASNEEIDRARAMTRASAEPPSSAALEVRRWLAQVGHAAEDLRLLATYRAGGPPAWVATL